MKSFMRCFLFALTVFSLSCGDSRHLQSPMICASFAPVSIVFDSQVESLKRHLQLGYVQTKQGEGAFNFQFVVPKDQKLLATFVAELDGEVIPNMSWVFHVPSTDKASENKGTISIYFLNPPSKSSTKLLPTLELEFNTSGENHRYEASPAFIPTISGTKTRHVSASGRPLYYEDYQAWKYEIIETDNRGKLSHKFKYTLNFRVDDVAEGEIEDIVRREPLYQVYQAATK